MRKTTPPGISLPVGKRVSAYYQVISWSILLIFQFLFFPTKAQALPDKAIVSLNFDNTRIAEVLSAIEKQTGYLFYYNKQAVDVDRKVSIHTKNTPLQQALTSLFEKTDIEFLFVNDHVVLRKKNSASADAGNTGDLYINKEDAAIDTGIVITGKVQDVSGKAIESATISVKNGKKGVSTDADGKFRIQVNEKNATLIISSVGFRNREIQLGNTKVLTITMQEDAAKLNDVVVIGYGDKSRKKITTAISSIKSAAVNELPVGTLGDALAANAAGVQVSSGFGGMPGESPTIRIRGIGSLGADNAPLYVVDGYPLQSESNFASINPSDIESIEVLKDAASAAIYGSRAANGVVIVTTKRGKSGKTKFSVGYITGLQQITKKVAVLNKDEYNYYEPLLIKQRNGSGKILDSLKQYNGTDWQDAIFDVKQYSELKVSATGGTDKSRFSFSGGYLNQPGVLLGTGARRYTLRVNFDGELTPSLKVGVSIAPSYTEQERRPNGGNFNTSADGEYGVVVPSPIYTALMIAPVIPLKLSDGRYAQPNFLNGNDLFNTGIYNPVAVLENLTNHNTNFRNLGSAYLEWNPLKGLKYRLNAGGTIDFNRRQIYVSPFTPTTSSATASFLNPNYNVIYAGETKGRNVDWLVENTITYNKSLGADNEHNFKVLLLQSAQKYTSTYDTVYGRTGSYTSTQIQNPSASADKGGGVSYDIFTFYSLAARLSYDYKGKYLADLSIRRDGSSKFGSNNKYGTFRSFALAWRLSEERFIQRIDWISDLKLRASYGETGNANIGSFSWQNYLRGVNYSYGTSRQFGTIPGGYYNPDLTWEKNHQLDIGLDIGLFNDRVVLTADFYNKNTFDMILNKQLLGIVGYASSYTTNAGNLRNRGVEFTLATKNIVTKSFKWSTEINVSVNRNKVTDLGGADNLGYYNAITGWSNVFLIKKGSPIGDMYGYQVDGIIKDAAEAAISPKYGTGTILPAAGDMRIRDVSGDNIIDQNDITRIGNSQADFIGGMTNRISYKDFDLSFVLQGQKGGNIINGLFRNPWGTPGANLPKDMYENIYLDNNPKGNNDQVKYPSVTSKAPILFTNALTSLVVYDASFLRLRNITLGYNLPASLLRKAKVQNVRIYISGQNLFTLSSYPGYNPEVSLNGSSITQPGVDQGVYPQVRTAIVGINVSF